MKRAMISAIAMSLAFGSGAMIVGCEDTLEHEKTVESKDGKTKVEETKTTVNDDTGILTKPETKVVKNEGFPLRQRAGLIPAPTRFKKSYQGKARAPAAGPS